MGYVCHIHKTNYVSNVTRSQIDIIVVVNMSIFSSGTRNYC